MAKKPEARYIDKIHPLLPKHVYHQAMATMYTNGTPDQYYESNGSALWVEYKWLPHRPRLDVHIHELCTPLQRAWLTRANTNNVQVLVIVGTPRGGFISGPLDWDYGKEGFSHVVPPDLFIDSIQNNADIASLISQFVLGEAHVSPTKRSSAVRRTGSSKVSERGNRAKR